LRSQYAKYKCSPHREWTKAMAEMVTLLAAILTGLFAVVGYFTQKALDRRELIAERRREAYATYIKSLFDGMDQAREGKAFNPDEIYWRTRVVLYATDDVLEHLARLQTMIASAKTDETKHAAVKVSFDALLLSMRREIVGRTNASADVIKQVSPIIG